MLVIGLIIGIFIGIFLMCLLQINRENEIKKIETEYILTNNEIMSILYCIDLIIQYHGYNENLDKIYKKLMKIKEKRINE